MTAPSAWVLRELPIATLARALGKTADYVVKLEGLRDELVQRVLASAVPL